MPGEWSDGRLNALERRVENAATRDEMALLRRELRDYRNGLEDQVRGVSHKLDEMTGDPVSERRARNRAVFVAMCAAMASGVITVLVYVAVGAHP